MVVAGRPVGLRTAQASELTLRVTVGLDPTSPVRKSDLRSSDIGSALHAAREVRLWAGSREAWATRPSPGSALRPSPPSPVQGEGLASRRPPARLFSAASIPPTETAWRCSSRSISRSPRTSARPGCRRRRSTRRVPASASAAKRLAEDDASGRLPLLAPAGRDPAISTRSAPPRRGSGTAPATWSSSAPAARASAGRRWRSSRITPCRALGRFAEAPRVHFLDNLDPQTFGGAPRARCRLRPRASSRSRNPAAPARP